MHTTGGPKQTHMLPERLIEVQSLFYQCDAEIQTPNLLEEL